MFGKKFQLNDQNLMLIDEIGKHMPGGFFIYRAEQPEEILYANQGVIDIFGCADQEEFKAHTGNTFRGMLHPDDYEAVSSSIAEQTKYKDGRTDYTEYRIIRKDGTVRWVDDYGHFTETDFYGGIYYVFLSDITDKRERMESDMAVRQAVIEALSKSYHTVWLINNVETETFSLYRGDTKGSTEYSMPINVALNHMKYSQAKVQYIKQTVAKCDQERLQRELSIDSLVKHLEEQHQFSINYLRAMADGSERYFRIEFARLDMPDGKMGIVCGFKDVDADVRRGLEEEKARQKELEQRIALQERLLAEETQRKQLDQMITAMASDYRSVYYVDLDTDEAICYRADPEDRDNYREGMYFQFYEAFTEYGNLYVDQKYRDGYLKFVEPDNIRRELETKSIIAYRYLAHRNGEDYYEMLRMAGVRHPADRDDHIVHAVGIGFTIIDAEMRESMAKNHALAEALAVAEEANKAKTSFLSSMSHEIRTPMNAIIGLDTLALHDETLSPQTRDYLKKIGGSAQHLLGLINDILDMSRIESGRVVLNKEEFSFSTMIEQINTMVMSQCADKGLHYECRLLNRMDDYYIGDDTRLKEVLINILSNAVKFTEAPGNVTLTVEKTASFQNQSTLKFCIRDTGSGMDKAFIPRIFEAFSQEDGSRKNKYGSTGLGMAITKNIVELMNGTISVESEKGVGTEFTVLITLLNSEKRASDTEKYVDLNKMYVLIVDDDRIAAEHARAVLDEVGIRADIALDGESALSMLDIQHGKQDPYNLVLLDWEMPGMNGAETAKQIRSQYSRETMVLLLTAYNWDEIHDDAVDAGMDSFLAKPLFATSVVREFERIARRNDVNLFREKKRAELAGRRVLLAEDVALNAEIMMDILELEEIEVDHAENGQIAVTKFMDNPPGTYAAILMDVRMPVMDGLEATAAIRSMDRPDAGEIPIIALTANAFDEDVQRSLQAGMNAHLTKPVEPDQVYQTLGELIYEAEHQS
ncbi:MAG: response regulator [Clostridia bacterium]|nr:response regulator [Clostridia bacterium]